jgi:hypothetical protein
LFLLGFILLLWVSSLLAEESRFVKVKLSNGISLDLPRSWYIIDAEVKELLLTHIEAVLDLSHKINMSNTGLLLIARSLPLETYATVNVSLTRGSFTESQIAGWSKAQVDAHARSLRTDMERALAAQGNKVLEWLGAEKEVINNRPALVTRYRRSLKGNPVVFVELCHISLHGIMIGFTLSHRESEEALWKPVLAKIRSSFLVMSQ